MQAKRPEVEREVSDEGCHRDRSVASINGIRTSMMFEYLTEKITQGSLYASAGRTDDVCTLDLREGSEVYNLFGPKVTVEFVYTQEERRKFDADLTSLDDVPNVKAKGLVFLFGKGKDKADYLLNTGIPIKDIVSVFVLHYTPDNNTFGNKEKRSLSSR